jgi:hypothetical protein
LGNKRRRRRHYQTLRNLAAIDAVRSARVRHTSLGHAQPWLYRLPSLLGLAGATLILFRLTRRIFIFTSEIAWLATAAFVSLQPVQFSADDARPYALGLLAVVASTDLLLRLIDRPSYGLAVLYGITAGVMLHLHMLFGTILAVHAVYAAGCVLAGRRIPFAKLTVAGVVLLAAIAPLAPQCLMAMDNAKIHSFMAAPELVDLVGAFFPLGVAMALVVSAIAVTMMGPPRIRLSLSFDRFNRGLVVLWALTLPCYYSGFPRFPRLTFLFPVTCWPPLRVLPSALRC